VKDEREYQLYGRSRSIGNYYFLLVSSFGANKILSASIRKCPRRLSLERYGLAFSDWWKAVKNQLINLNAQSKNCVSPYLKHHCWKLREQKSLTSMWCYLRPLLILGDGGTWALQTTVQGNHQWWWSDAACLERSSKSKRHNYSWTLGFKEQGLNLIKSFRRRSSRDDGQKFRRFSIRIMEQQSAGMCPVRACR